MRDQTRELLEAMVNWPWFRHVGDPINDPSVITVGSWNQAIRLCNGDLWESVTLQAKNRFSREVRIRDWYRCETWNPITDEVKQSMKSIIENQVSKFGTSWSGNKGFVHQLEWDILLICMETEFSDVYPPILYANTLAKWYEAGHFPCGWNGPELDTGWEGPLPPHRLYVF